MRQSGARVLLLLASFLVGACSEGTDGPPDASGVGGSGGTLDGSTGGDGTTRAPYVSSTFRGSKVTQVDLLFMIDNSSSMSDKQTVLATSVADLVDQLIEPRCIDPVTGRPIGQAVNGVCAFGELSFEPVKDIHVGIVSSSLGNHGAAGVCEDAIDISVGRTDPHNNDGGRLIARGAGGPVPTFQNKGFLYYNPTVAGALATSTAVATSFKDMVGGVGQHGCGYEASLESVYRFLIEPEPYDTIRIDTSGSGGYGTALLTGTDATLLAQRADLRPNSLVSVVLVTDENDCSTIDGGQGFYASLPPVAGTGRSVLNPGTSACKVNPNDLCCVNCADPAPAGCPSTGTDPECLKGTLALADDQPNLRCFNQKQRYGRDFLYPVQRYIDGFTKTKVLNRKGEQVDNPLFADLSCKAGASCGNIRDPSLVVVTGIVGVPWQNIAVDPSDLTKGFKTAQQLRDEDIWSQIAGDPTNATGPVPPRDPHMIESIKPREGLPGPGSAWRADIKNGHEWDPTKDSTQPNADLQFACIYDLVPTRTCASNVDCDCFGSELAVIANPLCQNAQGAYTNTQTRAKAYPSTRILQFLQGLGDQGVVGSICPAQTDTRTRDDFGYWPAINALTRRMRRSLRGTCLPVALPVSKMNGQTPCSIVEVFDGVTCRCDTEPGRRSAADALLTDEMRSKGACRCEIKQLSGAAQDTCLTSTAPPVTPDLDGWCYVDPAALTDANCALVNACEASEKRIVRFPTPNSQPRPGATTFLRCEQAPVTPLPPTCR